VTRTSYLADNDQTHSFRHAMHASRTMLYVRDQRIGDCRIVYE